MPGGIAAAAPRDPADRPGPGGGASCLRHPMFLRVQPSPLASRYCLASSTSQSRKALSIADSTLRSGMIR
ncbi:Uncharacterised protein [Acinetobacter baumannii]|nr:Uncharacterised protein [Acinetobacter baumannii]